MNKQYILAIDQGTSGTKALIIDEAGTVCAKANEPLKTNYLHNGFVEQNPEEIFQNVLLSVKNCMDAFVRDGGNTENIITCGISNQRETFVVWNKEGVPLYDAVVWQCKRSISICERLKQEGLQQTIKTKTGLIIDPYFSATKLIWLYENNDAVKKAIDNGEAYFGTIDTWLLYKLTGGKNYATDYTNASRTLFFNLSILSWDKELLNSFHLSKLNLPECKPSSHFFGETKFNGLLSKSIPVSAMIGDSHAAAFGEGCFSPGTAKATMGTGCSILMNIGDDLKYSNNGMVTTICWSTEDKIQYALEGVIVTCGATIEWLKNELGLFSDSKETEAMASSVEDNGGVYLIPAFSGLGAPHWDMNRKAAITGLTFAVNKNHIVRAALESIPYQIKDVIVAMEADTNIELYQLMVDGGISANNFIIQYLADLLNKQVVNIGIADVSALGAAFLAGLQQKIYKDLDHLAKLTTQKKITIPSVSNKINTCYKEWQSIIKNK
ncbi:MAG: glycerol kinase GlpK [Bacteroidetes bacterium]|nr:glycerol kinase GlpK [Bacteroidota bacterium]